MNASIASIPRLACMGALGLVAIVGCKKSDDTAPTDSETQALAADGDQAMTSSSQSSNFGNVIFMAVSSQDPAQAATQLAAPTQLWPAGCVTRAQDPTNPLVIHVTFTDCTGPFGLVKINGEEIVTLSAGANGALHADFHSQNLTANGHAINHSASADIVVSGTERDITWDGNYTRETEAGVTVSHTSKLSLVADTTARCLTSNGTAQTNVGTREVDTTIKDYKICDAGGTLQCPIGTVTHTAKASGRSIIVDFDGSSEAEVTGPNGNTFAVPLVCGG